MVARERVQTFSTLFGSYAPEKGTTDFSLRPVVSIIDSVHGLI